MPRWLLALVAVALPLFASAAGAVPPPGVRAIFPVDGATNVPTNTRVWVTAGEAGAAAPVELVDATTGRPVIHDLAPRLETAVPAHGTGSTEDDWLIELSPKTTLDQNRTYRVSAGGVTSSFTTGALSDSRAPTIAGLGNLRLDPATGRLLVDVGAAGDGPGSHVRVELLAGHSAAEAKPVAFAVLTDGASLPGAWVRTPGPCIAARAVDLAGVASPPTPCLAPPASPEAPASGTAAERRHVPLPLVVIAGLLLAGAVVFALARRRRRATNR